MSVIVSYNLNLSWKVTNQPETVKRISPVSWTDTSVLSNLRLSLILSPKDREIRHETGLVVQ